METERNESLKQPPDESGLNAARLADDVARITTSLEQTQLEMKRTRTELTQCRDLQISQTRKTRLLWAVAALLVASLIGIAWVGSPLLTEQGGLRNRLPVAQASLDSMGGRLKVAEGQLHKLEKEQPALSNRIGRLETSTSAGIRRARSESIALTEGVKREMNQNMDAINFRIGGIESTQREAHDEVAAVQSDLASVRQDLAETQGADAQQTSRILELDQAQQSTRDQVAGLENRMSAGQGMIDALSSEVDRQRIDFEVSKNRADELVKGIYLTVNKTDVARQQLDGWLHIVGDGRIVWLHDAGAQHPIAFASLKDARPYQLVFTRVANGGVVGYLLVPQARIKGEGAN
jgi:chromosome segregation ATPase